MGGVLTGGVLRGVVSWGVVSSGGVSLGGVSSGGVSSGGGAGSEVSPFDCKVTDDMPNSSCEHPEIWDAIGAGV